ncbi:centriolin-like isoform X2 [Xenia sp. Carnegie-2017]|uniref:centriolin-like isoform X2 n=1 Tax=Xenia sp. Carnegie-2017 TaxID=2897299 RepID=UPI001F0348AE|nr:centriolin-like isoform X2 [Xenia sp. Carnegie-2017]
MSDEDINRHLKPAANPEGKKIGIATSVAYLTETLIKKITKEERLDLINSLTINLPKDKLNKKIKFIENLEKLKRLKILNLSHNMIEKIQKLESLVELRELNLSNNLIKNIEGLDSLVVLEVLDLSCNGITCIPRAVMKKLRSLKELKLSDNQVTSLFEVTKLRCLQDLTTLDLQRNPVTNLPHYREFIVYHLRSLNMLDGEVIKKEERRQADLRFSQEETQRLEVELAKLEKQKLNIEEEKSKANATIDDLLKAQCDAKEREKSQAEKINELEREIEAKNALVKAKNADLVKASENQYRLEQELAFYKLDEKFELLGQMPLVDDESGEIEGLDDSAYIGKATYRRHQFPRLLKTTGSVEQNAQVDSLRRNYEALERNKAELDKILNEKNKALRLLNVELEKKNDVLRDVSDELALVEQSLENKKKALDDFDGLAQNQLADKLEFINTIQGECVDLEREMNEAIHNMHKKQDELMQLERESNKIDNDLQKKQLEDIIAAKTDEVAQEEKEINGLKWKLMYASAQIKEEEGMVEKMKKELAEEVGNEVQSSRKAADEHTIRTLRESGEEISKRITKQEHKIQELLNNVNELTGQLAQEKDKQDNLEQELQYALVALKNEEQKAEEAEERENSLRNELKALEKNSKLGMIEADGKLKHASKEIAQLQENIKKLNAKLEKERAASQSHIEHNQKFAAKDAEIAKKLADQETKINHLNLQTSALQATNESLKDRLHELQHTLDQEPSDGLKDKVVFRLKQLLADIEGGKIVERQSVDEEDAVGVCLVNLREKYADLMQDLNQEKGKRKNARHEAKSVIEELLSDLRRINDELESKSSQLRDLQKTTSRDRILKDENENLRHQLHRSKEKNRDLRFQMNELAGLDAFERKNFVTEMDLLQDEISELQEQHLKEINKKDAKIVDLEAQLSEAMKAGDLRDQVHQDLEKIKRKLSERLEAEEKAKAAKNEHDIERSRRLMEESRKRIEADIRHAEDKIQSVENLLNETIQNNDAVRPVHQITHHIYSPGSHGDHVRYQDNSSAAPVIPRSIESKNIANQPLAGNLSEVHHHYGNVLRESKAQPIRVSPEVINYHHGDIASESKYQPINVSAFSPPEVICHHHYDDGVSLPAETNRRFETNVSEIHRHHHYGSGNHTIQFKKLKNSHKREHCNVPEHDELEEDVLSLEERLAITQSKLSSQITENKLNTLRSDLQNLENTVSHSLREKSNAKTVESHLDGALARLQDHMLTLIDHRANLLSSREKP